MNHLKNRNIFELLQETGGISPDYPTDHFYIKIAHGCPHNCSYCLIKKLMGNVKSKPPEQVLKEIERGFKMGFKKFVISADELGCYGKDIGTNFPELLKKLLDREKHFKLISQFIHPQTFIEYRSELINILKDKRFHSIEIPMESGNHRILELMRRRYDIKKLLKCVRELKNQAPHIKISTNIIVGFPTEKRTEFIKSIITISDFHYVRFFMYSACVFSDSCKIKPKVPKSELANRIEIIEKLVKINPRKFKIIKYQNREKIETLNHFQQYMNKKTQFI